MLVDLVGSAENVNIRLEKNTIKIEDTITLTSTRNIKLYNRSDHMVRFNWKRFANEMEEEHYRAKKKLNEVALSKRQSNIEPEENFLTQNSIGEAAELKFQNDAFRIEPAFGTVWPHSSINFNVFYRPTMVGDQNVIAYCEVEGRESRLPLKLKGTAKGPKAKFSYSKFKIHDIFINTHHRYEVFFNLNVDIA
jgi:hypothetical protein